MPAASPGTAARGRSPIDRVSTSGGSRTFVTGDLDRADTVFFHGMPLDSESWGEIERSVDGPSARADHPGHGRNGRLTADPLPWTEALMKDTSGTPLLVGHSIGCEYALRFAHAHPGRVRGLVLIAPFFIQQPAPGFLRIPRLVSLLIGAMGARKFVAKALAGETLQETTSSESAVASVSRPGKRQRFAYELARVSKSKIRAELHNILSELTVPVVLITGESDPLVVDCTAGGIHVVAGSGHYPLLSNASETASIIQAMEGRIDKD